MRAAANRAFSGTNAKEKMKVGAWGLTGGWVDGGSGKGEGGEGGGRGRK